MKTHILSIRSAFVALILAFAPTTGIFCQSMSQDAANRAVFEHTLEAVGTAELPTGDLVVRIAESFMGTPYVGGTLESEPETLQIFMDKTDCILFAEMCTCLALTFKGVDLAVAGKDGAPSRHGTVQDGTLRDAPSYELFCRNVQAMRYRHGIMDGYASRIHYTSEWILQAEANGILHEFTDELGEKFEQRFSFMSDHPDSYRQMRDPATREAIAATEKDIEAHAPFWYISQERLRDASVVSSIRDGDIIFIKSKVKGLDISHVAIARRVDGEMHFIHASSKAGEVILEPRTLADYAANGIRVARLK